MAAVAVIVTRRRRKQQEKAASDRRRSACQRNLNCGHEANPLSESQIQAEKEFISGVMQKYDSNGDRVLDFSELKHMMTELNDGGKVYDWEVKAIMKKVVTDDSNAIKPHQLQEAMEAWFMLVDNRSFTTGIGCCWC
mmetsp:Transcript_14474/g.27815  ORF Transcript_14474/g.27815 Transcript_14474/m.27815 type:complete len:137 (+) Transcript_14474:285-695(+)